MIHNCDIKTITSFLLFSFVFLSGSYKRSIGERRIRRYAKAEVEKLFADIEDNDILDDILEEAAINNATNFSIDNQDISISSVNNISESEHSNENLQLSRQMNDDEVNEFYVRRDLLQANIELYET